MKTTGELLLEISELKDEIARRPIAICIDKEMKLPAFRADEFKARIIAPECYIIEIEIAPGEIYIFKNAVSLSTPEVDFEHRIVTDESGHSHIILTTFTKKGD